MSTYLMDACGGPGSEPGDIGCYTWLSGTSMAAPHAAGAAALIWTRDDVTSNDEVVDILLNSADPIGVAAVSLSSWTVHGGLNLHSALDGAPPAIPGAPVVGLPVAGDGTVQLAWTEPASNGSVITGYNVYRSEVSGVFADAPTLLGPVSSYDDNGVVNGTTYYYKVSAINGIGEGPLSDPEQEATPQGLTGYAAAVLADGPVAYWRLGESVGSTAFDLTGNGHDGGFNGGPSLGVVGALPSDGDTAVGFDGINDSVTIEDAAQLDFGAGDFSIEAWLYFPAGSANPKWSLGKGNPWSAATPGWAIANWSTVNPVDTGIWLSDGTTVFSAYAGNSIPRAAWAHMVWVMDRTANKVFVYKDGELLGDADIPAGFGSVSNASNLLLGNGNGNPFTGSLDEVALYNAALSPGQVANHYQAEFPPP